ncbi:MAG: L,D-transpeptidase family protein, partial [Thermodesulfobacteria bacterium]|nr:L,D-transpeptidase family protein [Thermodesulfobacteriota bacterium]
MRIAVLLLCFWFFLAAKVQALERFIWAPDHSVVGKLLTHVVARGETLLDIARWYDLGYNQIILANPDIDPWIPPEGTEILIPACYVLPEKKSGIVVNLAEMRLYFFRRELDQRVVYTAPIGVGVEGKLTELGVYTIIRKKKNPAWHVPKSIREEDPTLPEVVPPGPENPLGAFALYLSRGAYAIHGTNRPWGIGRRVSHGCIRLYPEDIEALFPLVPIGTPV